MNVYIETRRHEGRFDELLVSCDGKLLVHAEMLGDRQLWIGVSRPDADDWHSVLYLTRRGGGPLRFELAEHALPDHRTDRPLGLQGEEVDDGCQRSRRRKP